MNKSIICILAAATVLTGVQQAQAADKEKYLIGGLLGGWILNEVFDLPIQSHVTRSSHVEIRSRAPTVVERHHHDHRPSGRYEYQRVKTWVPGYYKYVRTRCGRIERRWVSGHYEYRTEKVWVSYDSNYFRDRDRCSRH